MRSFFNKCTSNIKELPLYSQYNQWTLFCESRMKYETKWFLLTLGVWSYNSGKLKQPQNSCSEKTFLDGDWNINLVFQVEELCFKIWEKGHKGYFTKVKDLQFTKNSSTFETAITGTALDKFYKRQWAIEYLGYFVSNDFQIEMSSSTCREKATAPLQHAGNPWTEAAGCSPWGR